MNKVILIGRLVRDPETNSTTSGIKYSRFTIAVNRQFGEDQADFIPVVAWRNQAEFVEKYMKKGALVCVEGRFSSSSFQDANGQTIYRYEVTADRVEGLESKAQTESRNSSNTTSVSTQKPMQFENEKENQESTKEVPWELDL